MPKKKKERITNVGKGTDVTEMSSFKQGMCYVCVRNIKTENGSLQCSLCNKLFHEKCVPKNQQQHIPDNTDCDDFLCHLCYNVDESDSEDLFLNTESDNE